MPRQLLRRQPADPEPTPQAPRRRPGHAATAAPAHGAARHPQPQFQTPPSREPPPAAEPAHRHSPASAQAAIFSLFGRGVRGRPRGVMMDEDDGDDDELGGLQEVGPDEDVEEGLEDEEEEDEEEVIDEEDLDPEAEGEVEVEDEDEAMQDHEDEDEKSPSPSPSPPLPPNLREITNLASWTVSTHKPGFGVPALRNASPAQYWQSDGPQPHTLTLHFFKLVAIVRIRVYLNFDLDESYTPTKLLFLAGMGGNDLVEFAAWEGDAPCGWVEVPLEGVGGRDGGWVRRGARRRIVAEDGDEDEDEDSPADDGDDEYAGSVLKAMVVQMRIAENHQNGKDTHVRGFQVFAKDDDRRRIGTAPSASADSRVRRHSARRSLRKDEGVVERPGLDEPDWMGEPVIR